MELYSTPSKEVIEAIKEKKKLGEKIEVSKEIEIGNGKYREIVFRKKGILNIGKNKSGIAYMDQDQILIDDERLIKRLAKSFHYYGVFFDDRYQSSLSRALQSDGDIKRDIKDHEDAMEGCEILAEEGVKPAELVKTICSKVRVLRRDTNVILKEILDEYKGYIKDNEIISETFLDEVNEKYIEVMSLNFEKVLVICKGINIFETVQDALFKKKKKMSVRIGQKDVIAYMNKLDFLINYYKKILRTYESVLNLNMKQYLKQLEKFDKAKIEKKISLVRK